MIIIFSFSAVLCVKQATQCVAISMSGQIQGLILQAALPAQAAPDPNATNSLRMDMLANPMNGIYRPK